MQLPPQRKYKQIDTFLSLLCAAVLMGLLFPTLSRGQTTPETRFWVTDGTVNTIATSTASVYIGGDFNYVGPNTGLATPLSSSTAAVAETFPYIDSYIDGTLQGEIYTVISDNKGGWFIGGSFTQVNNQDHAYLIHISSNNALDASFNFKPNKPVHTLKLSSDNKTLYVGGQFTNISSAPRHRLAAIRLADTTADTPHQLLGWNPSTDDGQVNSLELTSDNAILYVGGTFSSVNGDANIRGIAALDASTGVALSSWASNASTTGSDYINSLALSFDDNILYAGGNFTNIGGTTRNNIAAISTADGSVTPWDPSADDEVNAILISANVGLDDNLKIYLGGKFTNIGGGSQPYLARLDSATTTDYLDTSWTPVLNAQVTTLDEFFQQNDTTITIKLYIGGDFTEIKANLSDINMLERFYIARFDLSIDSVVDSWTAQAVDRVNSLALTSNATSVLVGGKFTSIGGIRQTNLARLDSAKGSIDGEWRPQVNGPIDALSLSADSSYLYIAGQFDQVDNKPRDKLARFTTFNNQIDSWSPNIENGRISAMTLAKLGFQINQITIEPGNSNRLYASTENGLYFSNDGGASWALNTGLNGKVIHKVIIDPNTPSRVYATADDNGIFRSTDRGLTWQAINTGLTNTTVKDIYITSDSARIYLSTNLVSETEGGLFLSENQGKTWTLIARTDANAIAIDAIDENRIYLGTPQGVFIMERRIPENQTAYIHAAVDCDPSTANSIDPCIIGLDEGANVVHLISSVIQGKSILYNISNGLLFKSENGALAWSNIAGLPSSATVSSIHSDPSAPSTLYVSILGSGIYKSSDNAISWTATNNGITNPVINNLSIDPNDSNTLYSSATLGIIQKTTNGASSWTESHIGIPNDILYIGGSFFGSHPEFLAAVDTSTQSSNLFLNWDVLSSNDVSSLTLSSDNATLYVGGLFNQIGGQPRMRLAAIDIATGQATAWAPSIDDNNGSALSLALTSDDETLYVGGNFSSINNTPRSHIASINTADGTLTAWNPNSNDPVTALKLANSDHLVIASGSFTQIGGQPRQYLASITTSTDSNNATQWDPNPNTLLTGKQPITVSGGIIYIGGDFVRITSRTRQSLAAFTFLIPEVSASPRGGSYNIDQTITLSCTHQEDKICFDKDIFFTTDIDLANATWQPYNDNPLLLNSSMTLSFFSVDTEGLRSEIVTEKYIFDKTRPSVDILLPSGKYPYTHTSKLTCNDGDKNSSDVSGCSALFYTLDGSDPAFISSVNSGNSTQKVFSETGSTIKYIDTEPVPIRANSVLRVIGVDAAGNISREIIGHYEIERGTGSGRTDSALLFILLLTLASNLLKLRRNNTSSQHRF